MKCGNVRSGKSEMFETSSLRLSVLVLVLSATDENYGVVFLPPMSGMRMRLEKAP